MTDEKYNDLFKNILKNSGSELENIALKVKSRKKISLLLNAILIAIILLVMYINLSLNFFSLVLSFILFMMGNAILKVIIFSGQKNPVVLYNQLFKEKVIKKFIIDIFGDVYYNYNSGLNESEYNGAIYNEKYDRFRSDDYVQRNNLIFSEILTEDKRRGRNNRVYYVTSFHGIAGEITLSKSIGSKLQVLNNALFSFNKLKLDNNLFEKAFDVYTSNKIMSMQILTSDIMMEILDLKKNHNVNFEFAIDNNKIYFRINFFGKLFEVIDEDIDKEELYEYYYILNKINLISTYLESVITNLEI